MNNLLFIMSVMSAALIFVGTSAQSGTLPIPLEKEITAKIGAKQRRFSLPPVLIAAGVILAVLVIIYLWFISKILSAVVLLFVGCAVIGIFFTESVISLTISMNAKRDGNPITICRGENNGAVIETQPVNLNLVGNGIRDYTATCTVADFFNLDPDTSVVICRGEYRISQLEQYTCECRKKFFGGIDIRLQNRDTRFSKALDENFDFIPISNNLTHRTRFLLIAVFAYLMGIMVCGFMNNYNERNTKNAQNNLRSNLAAVSETELPETEALGAMRVDKTDSKQYFALVPDVHIIVIEKDGSRYLSAETDDAGQSYVNPAELNTVLMLYQDTETNKGQACYYDITELYMNIPIKTENNEMHMLGELFDGSVSYRNQTGFAAVRSWFRDIYSINAASFTVIPQTVFSELYNTEHALGVSVNESFIRFMRQNYCDAEELNAETEITGASSLTTPPAAAETAALSDSSDRTEQTETTDAENPMSGLMHRSEMVKDMLKQCSPKYSASFQEQILDLCGDLLPEYRQRYRKDNAELFLNGEDLLAFANSVRCIGEEPEEHETYVAWILHSNWDIVLANLLESMTDLKNETYDVFLGEKQTDALSQIRSSVPAAELQAFLKRLIMYSLPDDLQNGETDNETPVIFSVRNLNLKLESDRHQTNVYLLSSRPLMRRTYVNTIIRSELFFCLSEEKNPTIIRKAKVISDSAPNGDAEAEAKADSIQEPAEQTGA